jgi:integrase
MRQPFWRSRSEAAGFPFLVHSHMLRHSTGYKLATDGQDTRAIQHYLGHRSIASTVRYTALHRIGSRGSGKTKDARHDSETARGVYRALLAVWGLGMRAARCTGFVARLVDSRNEKAPSL